MKRVFVVLAAVAAVATSAAPTASPVAMKAPDPCALGSHRPLWIDFADGSVPFWEVFARPGVIAAASNFIFPAQLRARGAKTIYWDMHLDRRVGTPTEPLDPGLVVERANRLYTYAAASTGCARPMIAENELFSAAAVAPWSRTNTQYRNDVLLFLQTLARHGAHPVLLVSVRPYTGGVAYDWWRAVAEVSDIVREVYFPGPRVYERGPSLGTRFMRIAFRSSMTDFLELGIPPSRLGLMLGFQTTPGQGGRERLNRAAWLRLVKLQAFAAKTVARDLHLNTIWSWGWGVWSKGEDDPDKPAAACVWLWAREPKLCDAPKVAGPAFNASRREGQLSLPHNVRCTVFGTRRVRWDVDAALGRLVGDSEAGFTAAYARTVASSYVRIAPKRVAAAERALVELRFGGKRSA